MNHTCPMPTTVRLSNAEKTFTNHASGVDNLHEFAMDHSFCEYLGALLPLTITYQLKSPLPAKYSPRRTDAPTPRSESSPSPLP